jgi:urease accessory protein
VDKNLETCIMVATVHSSLHPVRAKASRSMNLLDRPGWLARLQLEYAHTERGTHLRRKTHSGPLTVQKSLFPEGPEVCHTLILHPPGGIAGNDTLAVGVKLNAGAQVLITMPGATRWYRTQDAAATQRLEVKVDAGAALEWLPPETIVFDRAACRMHTSIDVDAHGSYLGWEILCLGRTASGERFDAGDIRQTTEISVGGELLWSERCRLDGGSPLLTSAAGLGGAPVSAIMLAAGNSVVPELVAQCREIKPDGPARSGITAMPNVFVARYVGYSSEQAKCYFIELWRVLRPFFTGRAAVTPRIWTT